MQGLLQQHAYERPLVASSMRRDLPVGTDLHMPGQGGNGLTAALRDDPRTRDVPIIVVTGLGGARDWEILRRLGADRCFLVKPVAVDSLVAAVRAVVAQRSARAVP